MMSRNKQLLLEGVLHVWLQQLKMLRDIEIRYSEYQEFAK